MFNISYEIWLMLGVIGFYIADSFILSFHNEILLSASAAKRWRYLQHGSGLELAGKYLNVPHVLKPYQLLFKLRWQVQEITGSQQTVEVASQLQHIASLIRPLQILVMCLAVQILIFLPVIIYLYGLGLLFLIVLLCVYCTTLLALLLVFLRRQAFGLSLAAFVKLAFDVLICPPFSVNLLRKLGLSLSITTGGLALAACLLPAQAYQLLIQDIIKELNMMQVLEDDTASDAYRQLERYRLSLEQQLT